MPTPWLSWPRRFASTRCSATMEASAGELPPATPIRLASAGSFVWSIFMLPPFCRRAPAPRKRSQRRVERFVILLLEAADQLGGRQDLADAAHALPGAPDFLPRLRLGALAGGIGAKAHPGGIGGRQVFRVHAGRDDRRLQIVAVHAGEEIGIDDVFRRR